MAMDHKGELYLWLYVPYRYVANYIIKVIFSLYVSTRGTKHSPADSGSGHKIQLTQASTKSAPYVCTCA